MTVKREKDWKNRIFLIILFISTLFTYPPLHADINRSEEMEFQTNNDSPIVVSLGCHCAPASYMSAFGLRKIGFPFDWLFSNNFAGFCKLLQDDFSLFLDPTHLTVHHYLPFVVVNDVYQIEFRHDFPFIGPSPALGVLVENWLEYLPEVIEKYERRIKRFNQLAFYKGKIFFLRMAYNSPASYEWPKVVSRQEAIILRDILREKFPLATITLVIINYANEISSEDAQNWHLEGIENFSINDYDSGYKEIFTELGLLENYSSFSN